MRTSYRPLLFALALAASATLLASCSSFRATPPSPGPTPELHAPVPERTVLENGLTLLTVHRAKLPLVSLNIVIRSGSAVDPKGRAGMAGFLAEVLRAGPTTRSAEQIADEIETLGASLHVAAEEDALSLSATSLASRFEQVFEIVADVLTHPAFAQDEIERVRRKRMAALARALDEPRYVAARVFRRAAFGDHPYGHTMLGDAAGIEAIGKGGLESFYRRHLRPANTAVIVVGSMDPEAVAKAVEQRLGAWQGASGSTEPPPPPAALPARLALVERPGAPQSQLRIGHLGVARSHSDYFPIVMCNAVLGGLFNSRINMNLREDKGYTYGAYSSFDFMRGGGAFFVSTGVETPVTAPAIGEVLKEIQAIREADVPVEELAAVKSRYSLSLSGYFQSVQAIAGILQTLFLYDLPLDYYQRLPEKIAAVDVAQVRRVAQEHLTPEALSIVVVGDPDKVKTELEQLGRGALETWSAAGEPPANRSR